jgi:hypothetical protein
MKKEMIFGIVILIVIMGIIPGIIIFKRLDNTNYNRIYISSLEFDGRLAEYSFKPEVSNDESYKIRFKLKDSLKENVRISLYKIEDGKELNIKLNENFETDELQNLNQTELKLVVYIEKSYKLLDKDYIDIAYLSINNAN